MKVFNLGCSQGHGFEGWFASEADFTSQEQRAMVSCPMCGDSAVHRLPSAPRLNLSRAREQAVAAPSLPAQAAAGQDPSSPGDATPEGAVTTRAGDLQAAWLQTVRRLMAHTEDVGDRFAEEARRMHYGEKPERGIRGQASAEEREALREEGIETLAIPVPAALKGPMQ